LEEAFSIRFVVELKSFAEFDRWGLVKLWEVVSGDGRAWTGALRSGVAVEKLGVETVLVVGGRVMFVLMEGEERVRAEREGLGEEAGTEARGLEGCRKLATSRETEEKEEEEEGEVTEGLPSHRLFASIKNSAI